MAGLVALLTLYSASGPSAYFFSSMLATLMTAAIGLSWLVISIIALTGRHRFKRWWRYLIVPAIALVTFSLIALDIPAKTAFALARPSMERIARQQLNTPQGNSCTAFIGVYGSCTFTHDGNAVTIGVSGAGFIDTVGFAYCPAGAPNGQGRYTPAGGPWYDWFLKF